MRDHDDVPYIVIERESGGGFGAFVLGSLVGAGLALLFAPRSGEETQAEIRERGRRIRENAEDRVKDAQREIEARLENARTEMGSRVDQVRDAVDSGRQAAREARAELERKLDRSKQAYRAGIDAARETAKEPDAPAGGEGEAGQSDEGDGQEG